MPSFLEPSLSSISAWPSLYLPTRRVASRNLCWQLLRWSRPLGNPCWEKCSRSICRRHSSRSWLGSAKRSSRLVSRRKISCFYCCSMHWVRVKDQSKMTASCQTATSNRWRLWGTSPHLILRQTRRGYPWSSDASKLIRWWSDTSLSSSRKWSLLIKTCFCWVRMIWKSKERP